MRKFEICKVTAARRHTALAGIFTGMALVCFIIESAIPLPLPGVRPGLANVFTLVCFALYGPGMAAAVLASRIALGSLLVGNLASMLYGAAGGSVSYLFLLCLWFRKRQGKELPPLWVQSVLSALLHNFAQVALAAAIGGQALWRFLPLLLFAGIVAGAFTGVAAQAVEHRLRLHKNRLTE